jgi:hypothetical protein
MTELTKNNDQSMFNWYYILWSDAINFTRSSIKYIGIWKLHTLTAISFCMAINLLLISRVLKLQINTHFIHIFNNRFDNLIGFIIVFFLPPLVINYLLIFPKNQWDRIRKDYKYFNGKVYKMYFVLSIVLPVAVLIVLKLAHDFFGLIV